MLKVDAIKMVEKEIEVKERIIKMIPEITEVLKKFEGKQVTKRLETALKKIDENLRVTKEFNTFEISLYNEDRCIKTTNGCSYINSYSYVLSGCIKNYYGDGIEQNGVFIYENAIKLITIQTQNKIDVIEKMKNNLKNIDSLQKEKEELQNKIKIYNDNVDYSIKKYFDLEL
jgi:hypothetical protein